MFWKSELLTPFVVQHKTYADRMNILRLIYEIPPIAKSASSSVNRADNDEDIDSRANQ